ncbi:GspH/FimT family pseudopilin [Marimonas arenosa]|uniref:Type II secretion system protein H n=1 Tax=Marimonas arenosa TaxID=1795305 RepID=A0AAE3WEE5_9RHOB|nr:GspH/FimT family pseudopilin [Marimonas arenosa]MDQ2090855.1 GspH/FimT family pseudopilin [Marimonas arenosa]
MSRAGDGKGANRRGADGFTLIELLVVMTLMALVAALATPMLGRVVPGLEVKAAAQDLGGELRRARSVALRDNREATVLIDVAAGSYRGAGEARDAELPSGVTVELVMARRERIDDDRGRIRFYPDGTSTGGRIILARGSARYELEVDWFDGMVRMHETDAR